MRLNAAGGTAHQVLAAPERHEGDFEVSDDMEAVVVELLLEPADRLDAQMGWSDSRRRMVLLNLR